MILVFHLFPLALVFQILAFSVVVNEVLQIRVDRQIHLDLVLQIHVVLVLQIRMGRQIHVVQVLQIHVEHMVHEGLNEDLRNHCLLVVRNWV